MEVLEFGDLGDFIDQGVDVSEEKGYLEYYIMGGKEGKDTKSDFFGIGRIELVVLC